MKRVTSTVVCALVIALVFSMPVFAAGIDTDLLSTINRSDNINSISTLVMPSSEDVGVRWANWCTVTASTLNVRSGPGLDYSTIGTLHQDDWVCLYSAQEVSANGYTWVPIYNENHTAFWGWVAKEYLQVQG